MRNNRVRIVLEGISFFLIPLLLLSPLAKVNGQEQGEQAISGNSLVKGSSSSVYYITEDGKRYVFPNEKTFKSWHTDFSLVTQVSDSALAAYPLVGNMTYRPGKRMIKIESDPKVYAIDVGGVIRWVSSEQIAKELYGDDWNRQIDDVSVAFFVHYTAGATIFSKLDFNRGAVTSDTISEHLKRRTDKNGSQNLPHVFLPPDSVGFLGGGSRDSAGPAITNVAVSNLTTGKATVTWTTNEPSTAVISFGTNSSSVANSTTTSEETTSHSKRITGLTHNSTYTFQIIASDTNGNTTSAIVEGTTTLPNIVFILLDDLGYGDFGVYNGTYIDTSEVDEMARNGVRLTNFYSNGDVCTPTRASILTGQYPRKFGIEKVYSIESTDRGLSDDFATIADIARTAGYRTYHVGKWHLGSTSTAEFLPEAKGFEEYAYFPGNLSLGGNYTSNTIFETGNIASTTSYHATDVETDYAIKYINNHATTTFFINLWYNAPHRPLEPLSAYSDIYLNNNIHGGQAYLYAGMVDHLDKDIGDIQDELESLGLLEDTLIIVTSDNGGIPNLGTYDTSGALRGNKNDLLEGGIKEPFIAYWPGHITASTTNSTLAITHDLFPTFADIMGVDVSGYSLEGKSIKNALLSGSTVTESNKLFWEGREGDTSFSPASNIIEEYAVRSGDWKLVKDNDPDTTDSSSKLYDLANDPYETTDLAGSNSSLVSTLFAEYKSWRKSRSLVAHSIASTTGSGISTSGTTYTFSTLTTDTAIKVTKNTLLDISDGDFTFHTKITPHATDTAQVIAESPNTWQLFQAADNTIGLTLYEYDTGSTTTMYSTTTVTKNVEMDIKFVVVRWVDSNNDVYLYTDGIERAYYNPFTRLALSGEKVHIGNRQSLDRQYQGIIDTPLFYVMAMNKDEAFEYQ